MRVLILTDPGCEAACATEIVRITGAHPEIGEGILFLEGSIEQAASLAYGSQVARKVLLELTHPFSGDLPDAPPSEEVLSAVCGPVRTQGFRANAEGSEDAQELVRAIGAWVVKTTGLRVQLSDPDIIAYAARIGERTYLGIDTGGEMEKREWRIMPGRRGLKTTVAAAAAILAEPKGIVLDPYADDGIIAIETSLLRAGKSPRAFIRSPPYMRFHALKGWVPRDEGKDADEGVLAYCTTLQEMKAVRTQSKLAGIERTLTSTRVAIDWADLKLEEASIDRIICYPLTSGRAFPPPKAERFMDDFCNQCAFLLKRSATMTCVTDRVEELIGPATRHKLKEVSRTEVHMGKRTVWIVKLRR